MADNYSKEIEIPQGIDISIDDKIIIVKGQKGHITRDFSDCRFKSVVIEKNGNKIEVKAGNSAGRKHTAFIGSIAAHIKNMIKGVSKDYVYTMKIFYTHFPISVAVKDREVQIKNFLGEKGARIAKISGDAQVKIDKEIVTVSGINKEEVGQTAANIEKACKIKGRDRRVFQDGIYLHSKV